jgi:hypothetical protein
MRLFVEGISLLPFFFFQLVFPLFGKLLLVSSKLGSLDLFLLRFLLLSVFNVSLDNVLPFILLLFNLIGRLFVSAPDFTL